MFETIPLMPAIGWETMTGVYWGCLILGGGLVLVSLLSQGDDGMDADVDVDIDVDADAGFEFDADADAADGGHLDAVHGTALSQWLSLRFMVYFLAVFGAFGLILTYVAKSNPTFTLAVAAICAIVVGQTVHRIFRYLKQTSGGGETRPADYVNKLARVTVDLARGRKGQVALQVRGTRRCISAVARHEDGTFASGDDVVVVSYRAGVAEVVSRDEFEKR